MMCLMLLFVEAISCHPLEEQAVTGWASQYGNGGVMEATIQARQDMNHIPQDIDGYDGFIAVLNCGMVGQVAYLRPANQREWEKFLIVDCACRCHPDTIDWMTTNNILVEVDYQTAERWGTVGAGIRIDMITSLQENC